MVSTTTHLARTRVLLDGRDVLGAQAWCETCGWEGTVHDPEVVARPNEAAAADASRHRDENHAAAHGC